MLSDDKLREIGERFRVGYHVADLTFARAVAEEARREALREAADVSHRIHDECREVECCAEGEILRDALRSLAARQPDGTTEAHMVSAADSCRVRFTLTPAEAVAYRVLWASTYPDHPCPLDCPTEPKRAAGQPDGTRRET